MALLACRGGTALEDTAAPPPGEPIVRLATPPQHVVIVSIDTLRRDSIDRYAFDGVRRMPFLSSLLAESIVADDVTQCSDWTTASMLCTMTGLLPGVADFVPQAGQTIPEGQRTLAGQLAQAGFRTAVATANINYSGVRGSTQGFELEALLHDAPTSQVVDAGIELWAQLASSDRKLLQLHLYEPHQPYVAPDAYLDLSGLPDTPYDLATEAGQMEARSAWSGASPPEQQAIRDHLLSRYDGELRYLDDQLVDAWTRLKDARVLDDALVVFMTDHGEQFWEHGHSGHAQTLGREENDAILAFWSPDLEPRAWKGPVQGVDLMPTVLDAVGLETPEGLSGVALGAAPAGQPRFAAAAYKGDPVQAIHVGSRTLQVDWSGEVLLWDREVAPRHQVDLSSTEPGTTATMWGILEPRVRALEPLLPDASVNWDQLP